MKDAQRFDVGVGRGDVVVVGSDGLMDNLVSSSASSSVENMAEKVKFDEDILDTLAQFAPPSPSSTSTLSFPKPKSHLSPSVLPPFSPQKVSEALCQKAREISETLNATTPFMVRAIEEGIDFVGGKRDGAFGYSCRCWLKIYHPFFNR